MARSMERPLASTSSNPDDRPGLVLLPDPKTDTHPQLLPRKPATYPVPAHHDEPSPEEEAMDGDLVVRAQRGDQTAFTELASQHYDRLHQIAFRVLRDRATAEDAAQQAIVSIWRNLPQLREPHRFDAWSYRLLINACNDEARKMRRRLPPVGGSSMTEPRAADGYGPVIERDRLERAFEHLSVDHRAVIVMHHYLDMSVEAVAEALDVPLGTVNSRLNRALEKMRMALQADMPATAADDGEATA